MSTRVTRQRSSGSGAVAGGSGGVINKLQLRSGKQITLAKWMRLQHVPEYGIVEKVLPMHTGNDNDNTARLPTTNSNNASYGVAKTQEQVTASNMKHKKDAAIDSILPPTTQEIYSHIRYLSEEGIKLVLGDIDICASESLKYSAVEHGGGGRNSDNNNNNGCNTVHLKTLAEVIHDYIQKFQPDYSDDDDTDGNHDVNVGGTQINDGDTSIEESEQQRTADDIMADMIHCGKSRKHCPTLLPFIIIKCYPNILDRSEMTKVLSLDLSSKPATVNNLFDADVKRPSSSSLSSTQPSSSSCVVTIKSTSNLVQQGHLVAEILSQCISNDPNGEEYAVELTRQRKRLKSQVSRVDVDGAPSSGGIGGGGGGVASIFSTWSWTNSLVDWCSTVDCFDSIIVLLEDVENIPSPVLDTFFTTLISLRSWHGIPINVVLMDSVPGGLGDRLSMLRNPSNHDSGGGDGGMAVCELELPLPQIQFDIFVNRLFLSGKCIPSFLWTNESIWDHAQEIFHEVDNSIISLARHLKSELRRYFTVPGAFLTLLHSKEFVIPNESRLKWLFGEESSRKFLSIQHESSSSGKKSAKNKQEDKKDGHIVDLFQKIQISYFCHQLLQKIYTIFDLTPFREVRLSTLTRSDVSERVPKLVHFLQSARQRFASAEIFEGSISILTKLDEYIILLGECANEAEDESVNQMAKLLVEDIIHWVEDCFPLQIVLIDPLPPSIQPRRDVAKALVSPLPKELSKHCLSYATRIAFQVFQSRVMTLSDWYNRYFEVVTQSGTTTNSRETAFFFAVYELIHLGFVRKVITGRRSEETYEKIAMVWGSGR